MKTFTIIKTAAITACIILAASTSMAAGFGGGYGGGFGKGSGYNSVTTTTRTQTAVAQLAVSQLSQAEQDGLLKMREEEKLARDVYLYLYDLWQNPVFSNISQSEQRHMDAIKTLLDKYGLTDPVADLGPGQFYSAEMQELYETLTAKGSESLEAALQVGATIEDLDIKDLEELLEATDNEDIEVVYQNLMKGSRNHLRSFGSQLASTGVNYKAQFLSQDEVDAIINSARERGRVDKDGNQVSGPRGYGKRGFGRNTGGMGGMGSGANFIDLNGDGICDNLQ